MTYATHTPFVRWQGCSVGNDLLLTFQEVLDRLAIRDGQAVDRGTGWLAIEANYEHLKSLAVKGGS